MSSTVSLNHPRTPATPASLLLNAQDKQECLFDGDLKQRCPKVEALKIEWLRMKQALPSDKLTTRAKLWHTRKVERAMADCRDEIADLSRWAAEYRAAYNGYYQWRLKGIKAKLKSFNGSLTKIQRDLEASTA